MQPTKLAALLTVLLFVSSEATSRSKRPQAGVGTGQPLLLLVAYLR